MKGILHSKRFRTNLYRWLFMYVCVMMLLTTVITYSRYMERLASVDETANVTQFSVGIAYTDKEGNPCTATNCPAGPYRPTSQITYYFTVNTNFEVLTDLYLYIFPSENFEIISVQNVDEIDGENFGDAETAKGKKIYTRINAGKPVTRTYEVKVKYTGDLKAGLHEDINYNVISVGYTASQVSESGKLSK